MKHYIYQLCIYCSLVTSLLSCASVSQAPPIITAEGAQMFITDTTRPIDHKNLIYNEPVPLWVSDELTKIETQKPFNSHYTLFRFQNKANSLQKSKYDAQKIDISAAIKTELITRVATQLTNEQITDAQNIASLIQKINLTDDISLFGDFWVLIEFTDTYTQEFWYYTLYMIHNQTIYDIITAQLDQLVLDTEQISTIQNTLQKAFPIKTQ